MPARDVAVAAEANRAAETRPAPAPMRNGVAIVGAVPALHRERLGTENRPNLWRELRQAGERPHAEALLNQIGQQPQKTRPLDRSCKLPLLLGGDRSDPTRHDLAALRNVTLQKLHILIVDLRRLIARERAGLAPAVEGAPRRALGHTHQSSSPVSGAPATSISPIAAGASRAPKSRSRSRSRRGPRRSPRSNRSPRSPRPSRSSRSARRIIGDGPASCSSTLTVRKRITSVERRN